MEKSQIITREEGNKIIDEYFARLETQVTALVKDAIRITAPKALKLWTADGETMLEFGTEDEINEVSQITVGTPVKLVDGGKVPDGEYLLPDATKFEIKDGKVTKITQPTTAEIAASIRNEMDSFRAQLKAYIVRVPFIKAKKKTVGERRPFHKV